MLRERGSDDPVARLADDLSWGPIAGSMAARSRYLDAHCPMPFSWRWIEREQRNFRKEVERPVEHRVVWIGSSSALELAGYLWYLDRYAHLPAEVVRPDNYLPPHPKYGPAGSIGVLNQDQMADVFDNAPRTPISADARLFGAWKRLQSENAFLRVVEGGALVSAPLDYFDELLLAAASDEEQKSIRIVGTALGRAFEDGSWPDADFLFTRLAALIDAGKLEAQGNVLAWTELGPREKVLVRRPA